MKITMFTPLSHGPDRKTMANYQKMIQNRKNPAVYRIGGSLKRMGGARTGRKLYLEQVICPR